MANCPKCGVQLAAEARFCPSCGASTEVAAAAQPQTPPVWGAPTGAPVMAPQAQRTQTGLALNVAGLLCYLAGWITGLVFFFIEKDRFVRFHAVQSIIVFGGFQIVSILLSGISGIFWRSLMLLSFFGLISTLLWVARVVLWIFLMVKAYNNQMYKLPYVGDLAEKYSAQ